MATGFFFVFFCFFGNEVVNEKLMHLPTMEFLDPVEVRRVCAYGAGNGVKANK
jgi:hypothetical protein